MIERFGYKMLKFVVGKKMEMFVLNFVQNPNLLIYFLFSFLFWYIFLCEERDIKWQEKKNIFKLVLKGWVIKALINGGDLSR